MRIAFVGTNDPHLDRYPPGGGIESQVWALAQHLCRSGHEVHILTRFRGRARETHGAVTLHGIPSDQPDPRLSALRFSLGARRAVERLRPDLVYMAEKLTSYAVARTPFRKVYYTHNKDTFEDYRRFGRPNPLKITLARALENRLMARCDLILCPTLGYRAELADRGFTNTEVIPPGIAADNYRDLGDHGYIFFSGQLHRVKGIRYLLEAFARLRPNFPEYHLLIGGDGPHRPTLERLAARLSLGDAIQFRPWGSREQFLEDLASCSVYTLPSLSESFGIVTLEAMASGKPVVATDVNGPRDVVRHGVDGYLCSPADAGDLARWLGRLLADPDRRRLMGASGRERAAAYDLEVICERMERTFEGLVE